MHEKDSLQLKLVTVDMVATMKMSWSIDGNKFCAFMKPMACVSKKIKAYLAV